MAPTRLKARRSQAETQVATQVRPFQSKPASTVGNDNIPTPDDKGLKASKQESAMDDSQLVRMAQTAQAVTTLHMATVKQSAASAGPLPGATDDNPVRAAGIPAAPGNQAVGVTLGGNGRASAGLMTRSTPVDNIVMEGIQAAFHAGAAAQFQLGQVKADDPDRQGTMQRGNIVYQQGTEPRKRQDINATHEVNPFAMAKRENAVGVTELAHAQMAIITGKKPELLKRLDAGHAGAVGPAAHNFMGIMLDSLSAIQVNPATPAGAFTPQLMNRLNEVWMKYSGDETKKIGTDLVQHEGGRRDLMGRMLYMSLIDAIASEKSDKAKPGQADVDYVDIFAQAYLTQMGTVSADAHQQAAFNLAKMGVVRDNRVMQEIASVSPEQTRADTKEAGLIPENPAMARDRLALLLKSGQGFQDGLQAGINNIPLNNSYPSGPWKDVDDGDIEAEDDEIVLEEGAEASAR